MRKLKLCLAILGISVSAVGQMPGPVAHWDFENITGTTLVDKTGNGHDGVIFGGAVAVPSPVAGGQSALQFGTGKAVRVPWSPDLLPGSHSYTLTVWLQTATTSIGKSQSVVWPQRGCCGNASVLNVRHEPTLQGHVHWVYHDDRVVCCVDEERVDVNSPGSVADGEWHHVVAVRDREGGRSILYIDGAEVGSAPDSNAVIDTTAPFAIGHRPKEAIGYDERFFQGLLDEIKVYDRALTPAEVGAMHDTENPNPLLSFADSFTVAPEANPYWHKPENKKDSTTLDPSLITHSSGDGGVVTLSGHVAAGHQFGSELAWTDRVALPAEGTFAARVRFRGPLARRRNDQASVKAFFTYRSDHGVNHMEHDFEALTGFSRRYWKFIGFGNWSSYEFVRTPVLSMVTHYSENPSGSDAFRIRSLARLIHMSPDGYLTMVVTVRCEEDCGSPAPLYEACYSFGADASIHQDRTWWRSDQCTHTHHSGVASLAPMFNLWWLDEKKEPTSWINRIKPIRPDAEAQFMDVKWFYWNREFLSYPEAHQAGEACDQLGLMGKNPVCE